MAFHSLGAELEKALKPNSFWCVFQRRGCDDERRGRALVQTRMFKDLKRKRRKNANNAKVYSDLLIHGQNESNCNSSGYSAERAFISASVVPLCWLFSPKMRSAPKIDPKLTKT